MSNTFAARTLVCVLQEEAGDHPASGALGIVLSCSSVREERFIQTFAAGRSTGGGWMPTSFLEDASTDPLAVVCKSNFDERRKAARAKQQAQQEHFGKEVALLAIHYGLPSKTLIEIHEKVQALYP